MKASTKISLSAFVVGVLCIIASIGYENGWLFLLGALLVGGGIYGIRKRDKIIIADQVNQISQITTGLAQIDYSQNLRDLPVGWKAMCPGIRYNFAVSRAIQSLLCWAGINFGVWIIQYNEDSMTILERLSSKHTELGTFVYGGAIIACMQLIFGVAGAFLRNSAVVWLDGIVLLIIGFWNLLHDILLDSAVRQYGYKVDLGIFMLLGFFQIGWGCRRLWLARDISRHDTISPKLDDKEKVARERFIRQVTAQEDLFIGRLTGNLKKVKVFKIADFNLSFVIWLMPERAVCITKGFEDYFELNRSSLLGKELKGETASADDDTVRVCDTFDSTWDLKFQKTALAVFNVWSGQGRKEP